ncbi:MAG TPA: hypothetical protein VJ183_19095 [Chloroflexia bacterium]|nr:hypothetical protein [Chloroflexia bacterium]
MEEAEKPELVIAPTEEKPPAQGANTVRRTLKIGCLTLLLAMCGCLGTLVVALQSGPVTISLLGGTVLRIGSDDFVLSNYSFREGTTYFLDLNSNGQRNILEFRHIEDQHKLEVVIHHADSQSQGDTRLLTLDVP